ncbi:MAG: hypothetical protein COB62_05575 [Piscirickettsiaceae bacterium]|nr:MAG: hypothetical protein COB62_05575 [Piscirickettsiaceae bacterium]
MNQIRLSNGNLYLENELYEKYFSSIDSIALVEKGSLFLMMPVQQAGGGLLLKIRNAKGDRMVHAIEFFQQYGLELEQDKILDVTWNSDLCALTFSINEP